MWVHSVPGLQVVFRRKEALQMAAYTAAITVSGMGAMPSLPTLDRVCELMKERGAQELAEKVMN